MTSEGVAAPRIWALLGARAGDNDQVIALAEALGLPFETKRLEFNRLHFLGPRLLGSSLASLKAASRKAVLAQSPPDLTISTGHRSVPLVRALRQRSHGKTRSIHVGFPRVSVSHFDLVIATSQYPIADHPNLLRIPYALTTYATGTAQGCRAPLRDLKRPRRLLIVGGPTIYWTLDEARLLHTLREMLGAAGDQGGSVIVTSSPRTRASTLEKIKTMLAGSPVSTLLAEPGKTPSYAEVLRSADSIRVTADSVSMVSDAVWTGKPTALIPITMSPFGKVVLGLMDRLRPATRAYPQDLRYFWKALSDVGVTEREATPRPSDDMLREILARSRAVIDA